MYSRQIASVAVFFLGILAILFSISLIQALITIPFFPDEIEGKALLVVFAYVFPLILLLAAGLIMVLKRHHLAAWIISGSETEEAEASGQSSDLPAILFSILGIYLVISTLPDLGGLAGQLISSRALPDFERFAGVFWSNVGHYLGTLLQFVLGAYLFLHARGLERWWNSRSQKPRESVVVPPDLPVCPQCETPFDPADYDADSQEKRCSKCRAVLPESAFVQS
jgi:hypothetical protein